MLKYNKKNLNKTQYNIIYHSLKFFKKYFDRSFFLEKHKLDNNLMYLKIYERTNCKLYRIFDKIFSTIQYK